MKTAMKVYDNGVIREKPYWALEGFSKSIALVDEFGEIISNPEYDSLNFRTGEEAREYAKQLGLKEGEFLIVSDLSYYYRGINGNLVLSDSDMLLDASHVKCENIPPVYNGNPFNNFVSEEMLQVESFLISSTNPYYYTVEGVLFDKINNMLLRYPPKKDTVSYVIPSFISRIDSNAFYGCSLLKSIFLPDNIEFYPEFDCENLEQIIVSETNPIYTTVHGGLFNKEGTRLVRCPRGIEGNYNVPEGVLEIDSGAFMWNKTTSITIPESVILVENLYEANSLEQFIVSPSNPKYATVDGILVSKDKKRLICYPKAAKKPYMIPETSNTIQPHVLGFYSNQIAISIPNHVEYINEEAFEKLHITSITLGMNVKEIKYHVFYLGHWDWTDEMYLGVPDRFRYKSPLKEIHSKTSIPPLLVEAFDKSSKERAILYVPKGSLQAYKNAIEWCEFTTIIEE